MIILFGLIFVNYEHTTEAPSVDADDEVSQLITETTPPPFG